MTVRGTHNLFGEEADALVQMIRQLEECSD